MGVAIRRRPVVALNVMHRHNRLCALVGRGQNNRRADQTADQCKRCEYS